MNRIARHALVLLAMTLAACARPTGTLTPSPLPPTASRSQTAAPLPNPTATPVPPTSTPSPLKIGYLTDAPEGAADPVAAAVQRAAQEFGWVAERGDRSAAPEAAVRGLVAAGARILVVSGAAPEFHLAARAAALESTAVYVVGVRAGQEAGDVPPNMLALGGPGSRHDQVGFMAGALAGFVTRTQVATMIGQPSSAEGLKYRNGFLHGVRYTCPRCRVEFIDVANLSADAEASQRAALYAAISSDVFFAAAGPAGEEALVAAAQKGAWIIGSGGDVFVTRFGEGAVVGAERVIASLSLDLGAAVYAALAEYQKGSPTNGALPLSALTGAILLAPIRDPAGALSAPDLADLATIQARLADGSLETGIDPLTGAER